MTNDSVVLDEYGYSAFRFNEYAVRHEHLFHYTSAVGLAGILHSGEFWLSDIRKMNDPREASEWQIGSPGRMQHDPPFPADQAGWIQRFNAAARSNIQLGSFTVENETGPSDDAQYLRGYSRARNWDQYGDKHRGACLVFDRLALTAAAHVSMGEEGSLKEAPIDYADKQVATASDSMHFLRFRFSDEIVPEEEALLWRETNWRALLFRKNLDWQSECEYRLLVLGIKTSLRVSVASSLVAIVLGSAYSPAEAGVLEARLERGNYRHTRVARMEWYNGAPGPSHFGLSDDLKSDLLARF